MKKYFYIIISLILILNSGQLYCQFDLKIERRVKQKSKSHRVLPNNLFKSSIGEDELISIGNKLNYFTTLNRSIKNKSNHFTKLDKEPTGKLVKIDNSLIKNKINKGCSNKSFVRSNSKLTENLINGSGLQSVKKDKMEDGEEWIAVMDYLDENRSLFLTRPIINDFDSDIKELSTTQILESGTPITVPPNGSGIIFVDEGNNIKFINTDGADEHIISSSPAWYSVSISPDGSKLALIPDNIEPYIYIADLDNPENGSKIRIYNPLSADTINDTTLQFADVLTWSADGEYIYYDCLVAEEDGSEYWTINLLDVNNGDNIQLFELEDSMQVWGPSASNSGEYLLLDLYDSKTDSVTILLVDFNQDLPGIIEENGTSISNSRFSPLDDMVVFEYFDSLNGSIVPILSKIQLSEDKRIPASYSEPFVDSFRYPVWFVVGGIPVSVEKEKDKTIADQFVLYQNYPNPFNPTTNIEFSLPQASHVNLKIYNILGQEILSLVNEEKVSGKHKIIIDGAKLTSGVYFYKLVADNFSESKKMILIK